ncbi:hypothetical protein BD626DRAFT_500730 [Schizophyllum amplum]|uniref:MYND-type domain-containing protein n=1 Tax=Schizophyllum amplum TaxID=97359 RepID=A0A550CAM4_9AGAR|nr:hypothetical protein BD626DRAFT_500730 [Auriculariopsis ampla]
MPACYYCLKDSEKVKRCGRCQMVIYCSVECQRASWKATHKQACRPHPSVLDQSGKTKPAPAPNTKEWRDLEMDLHLQKWMDLWRNTLTRFAMLALDLCNHGPERPVTHWFAHPLFSVRSQIAHAEVHTVEFLDNRFPELRGIVDDPTAFDKLRFLIALGDEQDRLWRVRAVQFRNDFESWKAQTSKQMSKVFADIAAEGLMDAIENLEPHDV